MPSAAMTSFLAGRRDRQALRRAKQSGDAQALQQAIDGAVRNGTSVDRMQRMLKQVGVKDEDAKALVDKSYPAAPPEQAKPARAQRGVRAQAVKPKPKGKAQRAGDLKAATTSPTK